MYSCLAYSICVCTFAPSYIHTCIHTYIHTCIHTLCMAVWPILSVCLRLLRALTELHTYMHTYIHVDTRLMYSCLAYSICVCTFASSYIHTCIHTHIHPCIHTLCMAVWPILSVCLTFAPSSSRTSHKPVKPN